MPKASAANPRLGRALRTARETLWGCFALFALLPGCSEPELLPDDAPAPRPVPALDEFGGNLSPDEIWQRVDSLRSRPPVANDLAELRDMRVQHADLLIGLCDRILKSPAEPPLKSRARQARLKALAESAHSGPPPRIAEFLAAAEAAVRDSEAPEVAAQAAALRVQVAGERMRRPGPDQREWLGHYAAFAQQYALGRFEGHQSIARNAVMSAAQFAESVGNRELAIECWTSWKRAYPDDDLSALVAGTVRRLSSIGKTYELTAPQYPSGHFDLVSLRGRWVLLHVWRSNMPGCREQLQELARLRNKYAPAGLVLVGACLDDQPSQLEKWSREGWLDWQQLYAAADQGPSPVMREIGQVRLPYAMLVDPAGKLVVSNLPFGEPLDRVLDQTLKSD